MTHPWYPVAGIAGDGLEIDGAFAGDQVGVVAVGGNILDVVVARVRGHLRNPVLRFLPHAKRMADVEVEPQGRRVDAPGKLQVLLESLDQQARLRFNQQIDALLFGIFNARHDFLVEDVCRVAPGLTFFQGAAGLGLNARRPQFPRQAQRANRVFTANRPVVPIRLDPRRVPVRLPGVSDGIHHETVDVGNLQPMARQAVADCLFALAEQPGRPCMGHVGEEFETRKTQLRNPPDRLLRRKIHVGV